MRLRLWSLISILATLSLPAGGVMIKVPLADLVQGAQTIVQGRVLEVRSAWSLDNSLIVTLVSLQIQEILKGQAAAPTILIQTPGGQVGDLRLVVSDAPGFNVNETVLVFLKAISTRFSPKISVLALQSEGPVYEVLEKAQGKYSIDAAGLAGKKGYDLLTAAGDNDAALPLSDLKARIKIFLHDPGPAHGRDLE